MALEHNSTINPNEPAWADVDKTKLPRIAFADEGEADKKSTWAYPHHYVADGKTLDDQGVYTDGDLYLHKEGLDAAWAAAHGARSGEQASQAVIDHLMAHRRALGMDQETAKETRKTEGAQAVPSKAAAVVPAPRALSLPHLAARIFGVPLAITAQKLQTILTVVGPKFLGQNAVVVQDVQPTRTELPIVNGVAVLSIVGTLVKRAMPGDSTCDQTYAEIEADFMAALNDPTVQAIMLDVDSPGGEVNGAFDLADTIYQARGTKPIIAVANELAASAAYAIASAADRVIIPRTGTVGSVGVLAVHVDESQADAQMGLKYTTISAGARKNDFDPHAPLSAEAKTVLQTEVDRIYDLFVQTVARNRNLSADAVRKTEAAVYSGQDAVTAGFADEVGTASSALAGIVAQRAKTDQMQQMRAQATDLLKAAQAKNVEIAKLCQLADRPHMTASFLERGLTAEQAKDELLRLRTEKEDVQIVSHVLPQMGLVVKQSAMDSVDDVYRRRAEVGRPTGRA